HYSHKPYFAGVKGARLNVVNVANGLERVVAQIANASHCIATSLHGIIIAHAYGVPWTWLRIGDHELHGDSFKFEDFFTVLERGEVS
ncbi:polysaccharide pyruvyl transferase family protein, partial [Arthrobacter deserti]|nr:polysaccharide pyruvyl transferase family protein [Arthrobacter deserti]